MADADADLLARRERGSREQHFVTVVQPIERATEHDVRVFEQRRTARLLLLLLRRLVRRLAALHCEFDNCWREGARLRLRDDRLGEMRIRTSCSMQSLPRPLERHL